MRANLFIALSFVALPLALATSTSADPVPNWDIPASWGTSPEALKQNLSTTKLQFGQPHGDDVIYVLPPATSPYFVMVQFYGKPARAFPAFSNNKLSSIRFVLDHVADCPAILAALAKDYGPGRKDPSFANINWPPTAKFALTVVDSPNFCWPTFGKPGA